MDDGNPPRRENGQFWVSVGDRPLHVMGGSWCRPIKIVWTNWPLPQVLFKWLTVGASQRDQKIKTANIMKTGQHFKLIQRLKQELKQTSQAVPIICLFPACPSRQLRGGGKKLDTLGTKQTCSAQRKIWSSDCIMKFEHLRLISGLAPKGGNPLWSKMIWRNGGHVCDEMAIGTCKIKKWSPAKKKFKTLKKRRTEHRSNYDRGRGGLGWAITS